MNKLILSALSERKGELLLQSSVNQIENIASEPLILSPDSRIFGSELRLALDTVGTLAISVMHPNGLSQLK
jgi:hypothetical protein